MPSRPPRTYQDGALSHAVTSELGRLQALETARDATTIDLIERLEPRRDWHCLELGAGAGSIARWLATRCPLGQVTATDLDTRFLSGDLPPHLHVVRHDVTRDTFPDGTFDLIHARALLVHLPDRDQVLKRAAQWLRPGGWLIVEDPDVFPVESSPNALFKQVALGGAQLLAATIGTDLRWPRTMPAPLTTAGLVNPGLHIAVGTVGDGAPDDALWRATFDQVRMAMTQHGLLAADDAARLDRLLDQPDFLDVCLAFVSSWAQRPAISTSRSAGVRIDHGAS
ncbi:class I SAM-dependent methyltransferase [Nonomuraea thailandensis]